MKKRYGAKRKSEIRERSTTARNRSSNPTQNDLKESAIYLKTNYDLRRLMNAMVFGIIGALSFGIQMWRTSFVLTTPSDPLQYVQPALFPQAGFEFLDRTLLWLQLRLSSNLPIPPEMVGPITTLVTVSLLIGIVGFWLALRINFISSGIFMGMSLMNPFYISISTYTYPTQLMTLVIVITLIFFLEFRNFLFGGAGVAFALL